MTVEHGNLQVWWCTAYSDSERLMSRIPVKSPEEAIIVINAIALVQVNDENVYFNTNGLEVLEDGEWSEWYNDEGEDITEYAARLEEAAHS